MGYDIHAHVWPESQCDDGSEDAEQQDESLVSENPTYTRRGLNIYADNYRLAICPDEETAEQILAFLQGRGPMPDPAEVNRRILAKAFHNDPKV